MSVQHTPPTAAADASNNRQASLSRVNNDQRRWFAQTEQRFSTYIQQVEEILANGNAREEELTELGCSVRQGRERASREWSNMRADLLLRERQEAVLQGETRWRAILSRLMTATQSLEQAQLQKYPPGDRQGSGQMEGAAAVSTEINHTVDSSSEEEVREAVRRGFDLEREESSAQQQVLQAIEELKRQMRNQEARMRDFETQRRQDLQEIARVSREEWRCLHREERQALREQEGARGSPREQRHRSTEDRSARRSPPTELGTRPRGHSAGPPREQPPPYIEPAQPQQREPGFRQEQLPYVPPFPQQQEQRQAAQHPPALPAQNQHQMDARRAVQENTIIARYARNITNYGDRPTLNPFAALLRDENDDYYRTSFLYPFNEPPSQGTPEITEYKKIDGLAPRFSGKEDDFPSWVSMFIPNIHRARCPVSWKATALYKALDHGDTKLKEIITGCGSTAEDYARTINRLVKTYLHPEGLLAAKQKALNEVTFVKENDGDTIHKWQLRLEQLCDTATSVGRMQELLTQQSYEGNLAKMSKGLARSYLNWCRNKRYPKDVLSILAWLTELVEDMRTISRHAAQEHPGEQQQRRQQTQFLTRRERNNRSPRMQRNRREDSSTDESRERSERPARPRGKCPMDGGEHGLAACQTFKKLTPTQRRDKLREWKRCYSCLHPGHNINSCNRGITCAHCPHNHHSLLHGSAPPNRRPQQPRVFVTQEAEACGEQGEEWSQDSAPEEQASSFKAQTDQHKVKVALQTLPVDIYNHNNKVTVNLLMDQGATGAFMSKEAADKLQLTGHAVETTITGFAGQKTKMNAVVTKVLVAAQGERKKHWLQVQIVEDPAASYQPFNWRPHQHRFQHLRQLPLKDPAPGPVQIMIGMDSPQLVTSLIPDLGGTDRSSPIARYTRLGWVVGGPTGMTATGRQDRSTFAFFAKNTWQPEEGLHPGEWQQVFFGADKKKFEPSPKDARDIARDKGKDEQLHAEVARMWEVDAAVGKPANTWTEEQVFQKLKDTIKMVQGRYELPTLWKDGQPRLHNNFSYALKRLSALENSKAFRDAEVKEKYEKQMAELEERGFVEEVKTDSPEKDEANYLPHFPVIRMDKQSTQVRLIMDAAARAGKLQCLNDCLHKGPKLINELVTVLLRFRAHNYTLAADVRKMFFQITLAEQDRDYHRYLWRKEGRVRVFRWKVHPFGSAASPCIAMFTIKHHAGEHKHKYPRAAETIIHSTLVDDNMDSVRTVEEAIRLGRELVQLYGEAGMQLGKVVSNSGEVLRSFPEEMVAPSIEIAEICTQDLYLPLVKALGVIYICEEDAFTYRMDKPEKKEWTKREILKFEAKLYDPHGLISPHTIRARIILQKIWRARVDWDEAIPDEIEAEWQEWLLATEVLPQLRIPRCLHPVREEEPTAPEEVHIFCDASGDAYAAAAYFLTTYEGERFARLAISKAKVAPLHLTSIPRMELMAATLALDLRTAIIQALPVKDSAVTFWTDSTNVLCWLNADSRMLHTFVGTRVARIQQQTEREQWRWVDTKNNPADIPSRGVTANKLAEKDNIWFCGPPFLREAREQWPHRHGDPQPSEDTMREVKKETGFAMITQSKNNNDGYDEEKDIIKDTFGERSSWTRLVRIIAWCKRVKQRSDGPLTPGELQQAERWVVLQMQKAGFSRTMSDLAGGRQLGGTSAVAHLRPFLDQQGMLRTDSRLKHAAHLEYEEKFQLLLPKDHPMVPPLIRKSHLELKHAGPQHVATHLRRKYWILQGTGVVRRVVRECIQCRRQRAKPQVQQMAPLPDFRFPEKRVDPFSTTAADAAGPFRMGKDRRDSTKVYFVLFTCLAFRAVHLEPLFSMTATSFLQALDRFTARRGVPEKIVSDNGTNFTAAAAELKQLWSKQASQSTPFSPEAVCSFPVSLSFSKIFQLV